MARSESDTEATPQFDLSDWKFTHKETQKRYVWRNGRHTVTVEHNPLTPSFEIRFDSPTRSPFKTTVDGRVETLRHVQRLAQETLQAETDRW